MRMHVHIRVAINWECMASVYLCCIRGNLIKSFNHSRFKSYPFVILVLLWCSTFIAFAGFMGYFSVTSIWALIVWNRDVMMLVIPALAYTAHSVRGLINGIRPLRATSLHAEMHLCHTLLIVSSLAESHLHHNITEMDSRKKNTHWKM